MSTLKKQKQLRKGEDQQFHAQDSAYPASLQVNIGSLNRENVPRSGFLQGLISRVDEMTAQKREAVIKSRTKHTGSSIKSPVRASVRTGGISSKEESLFTEFEHENNAKAVVDISSILTKSSRCPYTAFCSVPTSQFNPEVEKKKKFGNTAVDVDPNRANYRERQTRLGSGRYARQRLDASVIHMMAKAQKNRVFTQHMDPTSLLMTPKLFRVAVDPTYSVPIGNTVYPVSDSTGVVRLIASDRTQHLHETYQRIKQTHDLDSLVHFVQRHPYFVPSTLHLSYVQEYLHQQQDTMQLLEQALAAVEQSFGIVYLRALLEGKLKLSTNTNPAYMPESQNDSEYDLGPEMATSILKQFMRVALFLSKKSLHSSAAAYSQIAMNATTMSLPSNMLLVMEDQDAATKQAYTPRPGAYLSLNQSDPGASLVLHDYYMLRSSAYQGILTQFVTYTCLDSALTLHANTTDTLLFDFVHLPRSLDEASVYNHTNPEYDVIPTFISVPNPSTTPIGTKIVPFTQIPLRYAANWCYTAAIAAYYLSLDSKPEALVTADVPLATILCFGGCRIANNQLTSKYNLSSLLLQRAILQYPEILLEFVSKFEDKYTKSGDWSVVVQHFTNKFGPNKYLDRITSMYVQRHVTLWKLQSVNQTSTFLPFLLENAKIVKDRYLASVDLFENIKVVRDIIYNEYFYTKQSFAFTLLEPSEYSESVASIPLEMMNARMPPQAQQPQQPQRNMPQRGGMVRLTNPNPPQQQSAQPPRQVVISGNARVEDDDSDASDNSDDSDDIHYSPPFEELDSVIPEHPTLESDDEYASMTSYLDRDAEEEEEDEDIEGRRLRDCTIPRELAQVLLTDNHAAADEGNMNMLNILFQEFIATQISGVISDYFYEILLTTYIETGIATESIAEALQTGELNPPSTN